MTGRMIYSALDQGSAGKGIWVIVVIFFVSAILIYFTVSLGSFRKSAALAKSNSKISSPLLRFIKKHPISTILIVVAFNLTSSIIFGRKYYDYAMIIRNRQFNISESVLEENIVDHVTLPMAASSRNHRVNMNEITGITTIHETDRLKVDRRYFYVECDLTPDGLHPVEPGKIGGCLPLHPGNMVRVDYIPVPPDRYRSEPLRVWLLNQPSSTAE